MRRGVAKGGQWGTYVPGRRDTGALKWNLQKFHNKGKKAVTKQDCTGGRHRLIVVNWYSRYACHPY